MNQKARFENLLNIENDKISKLAFRRGNTVIPFRQIDEDIIREYNSQFPTSFAFEEDGQTKFRQFQLPSFKPDLETFKPEELHPLIPLKNEQIEIKYHRIKLAEINNKRAKIEKDMNDGKISIEEGQQLKDALESQGNQLNNNYKKFLQDFSNNNITKQENEKIQYRNDTESARVKKVNNERLQMYKDQVNALNRNQFNTHRFEGETDEDYRERLILNAEVLAPMDQEDAGKQLIRRKFRANLKQIIDNEVTIDSVTNGIDSGLENVDNKLEINKSWNLVKDQFLKRYGQFNRNITPSDIISFFKRFIYGEQRDIFKSESEPITHEILPGNKIYKIKKATTPLFLKIRQKENPKSRLLVDKLFYSFIEDGTYIELLKKSLDDIYNETDITEKDLKQIFGVYTPGAIVTKLKKLKLITSTNQQTLNLISIKRKAEGDPEEGRGMGYGVHQEDIPKFASFGKLKIDVHKLYYNDILSVKGQRDQKISGFQNKKVSEVFVKIIMSIIKHINPLPSDLKLLDKDEKILYNHLIVLAGLNKQILNEKDKTIAELKKELNLIEGEIQAGNNNPMLKKKLYNVCYALVNLGVLTESQLRSYLKQF